MIMCKNSNNVIDDTIDISLSKHQMELLSICIIYSIDSVSDGNVKASNDLKSLYHYFKQNIILGFKNEK